MHFGVSIRRLAQTAIGRAVLVLRDRLPITINGPLVRRDWGQDVVGKGSIALFPLSDEAVVPLRALRGVVAVQVVPLAIEHNEGEGGGVFLAWRRYFGTGVLGGMARLQKAAYTKYMPESLDRGRTARGGQA